MEHFTCCDEAITTFASTYKEIIHSIADQNILMGIYLNLKFNKISRNKTKLSEWVNLEIRSLHVISAEYLICAEIQQSQESHDKDPHTHCDLE